MTDSALSPLQQDNADLKAKLESLLGQFGKLDSESQALK